MNGNQANALLGGRPGKDTGRNLSRTTMVIKKQNRILMFLENLPFPHDVRVRREAFALASAGYRVTVICPAATGQPSREIINGVRVYRYHAFAAANGLLEIGRASCRERV